MCKKLMWIIFPQIWMIRLFMQATMTAAAQHHQQHEQQMVETQAEVQEAVEAAQHAQAAEAETTAASAKVTAVFTSLEAVHSAKSEALAAAQQAQQALIVIKEALAAAKEDSLVNSQRHLQFLKGHISEAVKSEMAAASRQSQPEWKKLQVAAAQARGLLEGVNAEIKRHVEAATEAAKADILFAAETAVVAAAMQSLAAPTKPNILQVELFGLVCGILGM